MSKSSFQNCFSFILILIFSCSIGYAQKGDVTVQFDTAANYFTESLPIGNGRLGALVFGRTNTERIALNEISLWSGDPQDADNDSAFHYLKPIQELLLAGKNKEAQELLQKHFVAKGAGSGFGHGANVKYGSYQTFGDLFIRWKDTSAKPASYQRELNLETTVAKTSFIRKGNHFVQEVFADFVNDILWVKLKSQKHHSINVSISLSRNENAHVFINENRIVLKGQLPSGKDMGMQFAAIAEPQVTGGNIRQGENCLVIENANELVIKISMATNYNFKEGGLTKEDVASVATGYLTRSGNISFDKAQKASTMAYQKFFERCRLTLPENKVVNSLTTNQRLIRYAKGGSDPQLSALYFNFGRYLLISASRPGLLPANLQGLWATEYQAPWNGDYHLNINVQMNYWPAEVTNLGMLAQPLFQFINHLVKNGSKTAKAYYDAPGWVAHVISNPWFYTSPGEGADWGSTLTGGAWLCEHIWEHYRFNLDTGFLKKYYSVMKGAAVFLQSILIREPQHGWLVTVPSNSPENTYIMPNGFKGQTAMGPTMDMQICRELFNACITASAILDIDKDWRNELIKIIPQLATNQISADGGINEWLHDWKAADPNHRHVSQLYGLFPGDEITPWGTPSLAAAAQKTLEIRGDGGTGWSKAWKISFWARLGNGDHALKLLKELLTPVSSHGMTMAGGGTYPNLFCAHPPFQIDGNFGGTAGIAEMLLQSQGKDEVIRFLPALPASQDWNSGSVKGLKARGDFEINISWTGGKLLAADIFSEKGGMCKVLLPSGMVIKDENNRTIVHRGKERIVTFSTIRGKNYKVKMATNL